MNQTSNGSTIGFDDADGHMQRALELLERQHFTAAVEELTVAADLHRRNGHASNEARCLQMAATAMRATGDLGASRELADRAASIFHSDSRLTLSIVTEQAEGAFAAEDYDSALALVTRAIDLAPGALLRPDGINALLRRRARIYLALGNLKASALDYDRAFALLPVSVAGFVRTEQASGLIEEGHIDQASAVLHRIPETSDPHLSAEIDVLRAKMLRISRCYEDAVRIADTARRKALEAVAPLPYFAASVEMAESLQSLNRRTEAYGAMARAWATLGDLLGPEVAASWVEPCLIGYHIRWGDELFAAAKQEYEAQRRADQEKP